MSIESQLELVIKMDEKHLCHKIEVILIFDLWTFLDLRQVDSFYPSLDHFSCLDLLRNYMNLFLC